MSAEAAPGMAAKAVASQQTHPPEGMLATLQSIINHRLVNSTSTPGLRTPTVELMLYLKSVTQSPVQMQRDVLASILQGNARCEYLQSRGLDGRTDVDSFRSCIPISTYESIKHHVSRIANGPEDNSDTLLDTPNHGILCSSPVVELIASSGTSGGEQKMFPRVESDRSKVLLFTLLTTTVVIESFPGSAQGKCLYFYCMRPGIKTASGLVANSATSAILRSLVSGTGRGQAFTAGVTSPKELFRTPEKDDQMLHCHWLCGLLQYQQVVRVGALLASSFIRALQYLQTSWKQICTDLKQGKLHAEIRDADVRRAVEELMSGPKHELAGRIESICSDRSNWDGMVGELFPNILLVEVVVTGTMAAYLPLLRSYLGKVPIVSIPYASSEVHLGINLRPTCAPEDVAYTLLPSFAYYEFLPVDKHSEDSAAESSSEDTSSQLVDLASVKLGETYELVVTTHSGLYRYRMEDCLKVVGFYNCTPEFQFIERRNVVLSVDSDKTTENELLAAVTAAGTVLAEQHSHIHILDYTSYADVSITPGHYVVFLELTITNQITSQLQTLQPVLEACAASMENSFNPIYRRNRKAGHIAPLKLKVVDRGSFDLLRNAAVARGVSDNQYKTPRCLKSALSLQLLNTRTLKEVQSDMTTAGWY